MGVVACAGYRPQPGGRPATRLDRRPWGLAALAIWRRRGGADRESCRLGAVLRRRRGSRRVAKAQDRQPRTTCEELHDEPGVQGDGLRGGVGPERSVAGCPAADARPAWPVRRPRGRDAAGPRSGERRGPAGSTWRRGRHAAGHPGHGAGRGRGARPGVGTQSGTLRVPRKAISSALGGMNQGTHDPWVAGSSPAGPIPPRGQFYAPAGDSRRDGRTGSRADFAQGSARKCGVVERRPQSFPPSGSPSVVHVPVAGHGLRCAAFEDSTRSGGRPGAVETEPGRRGGATLRRWIG